MFKTQSKPPLARETTTKRRYHERRSEGRNLGKAGAVDPRQGAEAAPGGAGGGGDGASRAVQDAGRLLTRTGNGWLPSASPESTGPPADDQSCRVALCCFAPAHRGHQAVQRGGQRDDGPLETAVDRVARFRCLNAPDLPAEVWAGHRFVNELRVPDNLWRKPPPEL